MSMWVLHLPTDYWETTGTPGLGQEATITLPLPLLPDYTRAHSQDDIKRRLRAIDPMLPPEAATAQAERLWRYIHAIQPEDSLAIPLPDNTRLGFAQVISSPHFHAQDGDNGSYELPVFWSGRTAPLSKFRKFKQVINPSSDPLILIQEQPLRVLIRNYLRLPGSRFAMWGWILSMFFLMQVISMALRQWRLQKTGF